MKIANFKLDTLAEASKAASERLAGLSDNQRAAVELVSLSAASEESREILASRDNHAVIIAEKSNASPVKTVIT
jgi:hypothetical protein